MKLRKVFAVLLAAVMVFAIAMTASAEEKTLKVGVAVNATGWFADFDANNWEELVIYADMLNEEGGLHVGDDTYKIELVQADGQSDFAGMPTACMDLIDKEVDFVIETNDFWMVDGNQLLKEADILTLSCYPDFATGFWTDADGNVNDCLLSCANGAANDIVALLTELGEMYPDAHTVMYVCNADGTEGVKYEYVKKVCEEMGYELLEQYEVYDSSAPDMTAIAQKVAAADPDAYIGQGVISCIGQLIAALQDYDPDCICLASCGQSVEVLASIIGDSTKCNKIISTGIGFDKEKNTELMNTIYDKLMDKFGPETANSWAGNFVNCMKVYKEIVEEIGTIDKDAIIDYWKNAETLSTVYSDEAHLGGKESFGLDFNRMIVNPTPISTLDGGVGTFLGWYQFDVQ
ncbi:MAG: ABC transporter substrate-binding protein [Parasporobacterium sp.]|nr:ABC transporter substrate-binding protein [Parasporobacterium sp.]